MRICFISTDYPPEMPFGGVATLTQTAARGLARRGHDVTVITITRQSHDKKFIDEGVCVWGLSEPHYRTTIKEDFRRNWQVWRAVQKLRPEVVHMVEFGAEGCLLSLLGRKKYKLVTCLISPGTLTSVRYEQPLQRRQKVLSFMARRQALNSHALFSPSVRWARKIEHDARLKPRSIRQIVEGVDLDELQGFQKTEPSIKIEGDYLVYYGRLEERKGVQYLAQALPGVWEKLPDLKMLLIGLQGNYTLEGVPSRQYIEQAAGKYVHNLCFIDHMPREEVLPVVAQAKLAVLPSIWEPYAHTCIEAIALGVPVITTGDSGGNAEIIAGLDDAEAEPGSVPVGWLVPRRNVKALTGAILEALGDEEALAQVRERLPRRARRFDTNVVAAKTEELYRELLG